MKTDLYKPCPGSPSKKIFKSLLTSIWSQFKISKIICVKFFRTNAVYWNHKCLFVRRESALILFSLFAQSRFPWLIKARVKSLKKSSLPFDSAHLFRPGVNICPKKIETVDFGFWEFWNCLLGCLSDFLRTVYQILFTLSNDENKYHHWWFTNLKTLKKTRKSGHICASLTYITWISCDSCIICITCTKEISHQLILWDIIDIAGILEPQKHRIALTL